MQWHEHFAVIFVATLAATQGLPFTGMQSDICAIVSAFAGALAWQGKQWQNRGWKPSLIYSEFILAIASGLGLHAFFLSKEEVPSLREIYFWAFVAGYCGPLIWEQLAVPLAEALATRIRRMLEVIFGRNNEG